VLVHQSNRSCCLRRSGIGLHRTECNVCKRRFAGAVFADERVDFTGAQIEIHAVHGKDAGISFADAAQF